MRVGFAPAVGLVDDMTPARSCGERGGIGPRYHQHGRFGGAALPCRHRFHRVVVLGSVLLAAPAARACCPASRTSSACAPLELRGSAQVSAHPEPLSEQHVQRFLADHHGAVVEGLEALSGGHWSRAWGYRADGQEFVVRFGPNRSWYEADRLAVEFAGPGLPIPEVWTIGDAFGGAYAISERRRGRFLEDTPLELVRPLAATITDLLVALYEIPKRPGMSVIWHEQRADRRLSWREWLLSAVVGDGDGHAWRSVLDPPLARLASAAEQRFCELVRDCPERRDLVHGDLLHGNVLLNETATRPTAVFSWKCSVRGDFLYDAAWCTFWGHWHHAVALANPLPAVLAAPGVRAEPDAAADAALRHHCYELHIGITHLGWNVSIGDDHELRAVGTRLADVLERGPVESDPHGPATGSR
jgi:aminoglycoside phosphotransferase (APT) family kinase protein